ncbi:MAG: SpoIIE family protein phosphatase, partial [Bacteroidetes bacterium]|nr:SpoIIE family protein phosphatase [Bacteroidota bacterium]
EYRSDKMPVGKYGDEELLPFTHQIVELKKGDTIYIFTDGFADQFGGPKGKKFKYKQLEEKIMESHKLLMEEQKKNLAAVFEKWKGNFEQVDDVLVIGVKI